MPLAGISEITGIGANLWYPCFAQPTGPGLSNSAVLAATGDKACWIGRVYIPSRQAKNIVRGGFRFGSAITKVGGSILTFSLQDVDLANGPVLRSDEVQDQSVAITNAQIVASAWLRTDALNAARTVNPGDYLAAVIEYNAGGRLGADSITFSNLTSSTNAQPQSANIVTKTGGVWTLQAGCPNIIFEADDGTFLTLAGAIPCSATNTHTYKQDTGVADEHGLAFKVPFDCASDGFTLHFNPAANTANFDVVLQSGALAPDILSTFSFDANALIAVATARQGFYPWSTTQYLYADQQYYLTIRPNQTTSNVSVYSLDVAAAEHLQCHPGGQDFNYTTRLNLGGFAALTTTRRFFAGISLCGFAKKPGASYRGIQSGGRL